MTGLKCAVGGVLLLGLAIPAMAAGNNHGNEAVIAGAEAYLKAYQALDLRAVEALLAPDARFEDPTSTDVPGIGGPFRWEGRDAVIAGLRGWTQSVRRIDYTIRDRYEASGRVVFIGTAAALIAAPSGLVRTNFPIVTIVTLRDGKVIEHRDYTDYAGAATVKVQ